MKDSKIYAGNLQKYYRSAKRKYGKTEKVQYETIIESVIYGVLLEHLSESSVKSAMRKFNKHFVDYNDLRVSRPEEIIEMIGDDTNQSRQAASSLIQALRAIFKKYNNLNMSSMKKSGKRQAKAVLEKFEPVSNFCVDYSMVTALGGHAIPLTAKMIEYLRDNELVHPESEEADISGFLARQIPASGGYDFYSYLRKDSESGRKKKAKKKTTKKKTTKKKKTKKKTVSKKKK
jgi:hypothetical protein